MEDSIKRKILQTIRELSNCDGWAKQAAVCLACKKNGIALKEYGGAKNVFLEMSDVVEKRSDSHNLPELKLKPEYSDDVSDMAEKMPIPTVSVKSEYEMGNGRAEYVEPKPYEIRNAYKELCEKPEGWIPIDKLIDRIGWQGTSNELIKRYEFIQYISESKKVRIHNISKYEILDDIYFDKDKNSFPLNMEKLRKMTLYENWDNHLLENYIIYTYASVKNQKKIAISNDQLYACWNTGLVDYRYEPIYCYMSRRDESNRWVFKAFCIVGEDKGKDMNSNISIMPECAKYFEDVNLLCQPTKDILSVDRDHIVCEHPSRLPIEWLKECVGDEAIRGSEEKSDAYDSRLAKLVPKGSKSNFNLQILLEKSIEESIKRCQWNYKTAIPYYDPINKRLGWFLPLCKHNDNTAEKERTCLVPFAALVVTKGQSGRYQGETIYALDWAYRCARLVCRPDSDWLTTPKSPAEEDCDGDVE